MAPILTTVVVVVILGVGLLVLGLWAALRAGDAADRREMRQQGCYCPAGDDGFHLAGCPLYHDASDEAGA